MFSVYRYLSLFVLTTSIIFLASCSSGGGGGEATPAPTPITQNVYSKVGGNITTTGATTQSLPSNLKVLVEAVSIDKNGKQIDKKVVEAQNGYFSMNVLLNNDGGKIVVTASANGFNSGTKTIAYSNPQDISNINISVEIDPVKETIVAVPSVNIASGNKSNILKIGFFRDKNGITKTAVGNNIKSMASSGNKLIMELGIPVSKLATNTTALKVSYKDYKPSNPEDYNNFPGEETSDGQELISFGFDWLDIRDANTGENPFVSSSQISSQIAKTDLGEYYRILRYVDCAQIDKIKNAVSSLDEDTNKPGIQFTFWAFDWDQGVWIQAGEGVFVNSGDPNIVNYYVNGENENTVDTAWDYIIQNGCVDTGGATVDCSNQNDPNYATACIDVNGDNTPENVSCVDNHVIVDENNVCAKDQTGNYVDTYVVVSVTNPQLEWKNLDYIKPGTSEISCNVKLVDEDGNPISTWVEAYPDNTECIEWTSTSTSSTTGEAILSTLKYCDPPNGIIYYYDPINYEYVGYDADNNGTPDTVTFGDNCSIEITVKDINKCSVEGYIKDEDTQNPKSDEYVWVYDDTWNTYRWGYTDNDGKYSIKVPCGQNLNLASYFNYDNPLKFNVNGTTDNNETQDVNNVATLSDIIAANYPPDGYAWLSSYTIAQGGILTAYLYAWDYEGDTPIEYKMKVLNSNGNEVLSTTGTIGNNYEQIEEQIDTTNLNAGTYTVEFILADTGYTGDITTLSQQINTVYAGDFEVYTGNAAPTISYFYAYPSIVPSVGNNIDLYGWAYDLDDTTLTSTLSYTCYDSNNSSVDTGTGIDASNLLNNGIQNFTIPNNNSIKSCEITWEVSDGTNTVSEIVNVIVQNYPPEVYIWTDSQVIPEGTSNLTIYHYIYEPEGENVSCVWKINGQPYDTNCADLNLDVSGLNLQPGSYIDVELTATDASGNSSTASITLLYGALSDVQINIQ